jgi:membrane-associated phospholipid phosphatase
MAAAPADGDAGAPPTPDGTADGQPAEPPDEQQPAEPPDGRPVARARAVLGGAGVAAALAVAVLSPLVAGRSPGRWELEVVRTATDAPDLVGWPARLVMQMGTFGAVVSLALVTAWLTGRRRPPVAVLAAGIVALGVANRLKALVERPRPTGVQLREGQDGFGYPSSHTAVAVALAVVLTAVVPRRWRWAPGTAALVVGLARMHVGVHYPLDVVGGALVGAAAGLLTLAFAALTAEGRASAGGRGPTGGYRAST